MTQYMDCMECGRTVSESGSPFSSEASKPTYAIDAVVNDVDKRKAVSDSAVLCEREFNAIKPHLSASPVPGQVVFRVYKMVPTGSAMNPTGQPLDEVKEYALPTALKGNLPKTVRAFSAPPGWYELDGDKKSERPADWVNLFLDAHKLRSN